MAEKTSGSASGSSKRKKRKAKRKDLQEHRGFATSVARQDKAGDRDAREESGNGRAGEHGLVQIGEESSVIQKLCSGCSNSTCEGNPERNRGNLYTKAHTITDITNGSAIISLEEQQKTQPPKLRQESKKEPKPPHFDAVTKGSAFEEELEWCIGQLELGLLRPDASNSQKQENKRHIKTLRSSKTPMPRKRQIMRSLFGDYRSKVRTQPLPETVLTPKKPMISAVEKATLEATGKFYKQSAATVAALAKPGSVSGAAGVHSSEFRFDFDIDVV